MEDKEEMIEDEIIELEEYVSSAWGSKESVIIEGETIESLGLFRNDR